MKKVPKKLPEPVITVEGRIIRVVYPHRNWGVDDYFEITVYLDGKIEIRGHDGVLVVRPNVANLISVALEDF